MPLTRTTERPLGDLDARSAASRPALKFAPRDAAVQLDHANNWLWETYGDRNAGTFPQCEIDSARKAVKWLKESRANTARALRAVHGHTPLESFPDDVELAGEDEIERIEREIAQIESSGVEVTA